MIRSVRPRPRLLLLPMTLALIDALVAGDKAGAEAALAVRFPEPLRPPPETDDVLGVFRGHLARGTDFPPYLIVRAADRAVIGSAGTSAPDPHGVVVLGYGVYPEHEGSGYATEAATVLCRARLADDRVKVVRATIPIGHTVSEKVATGAGLSATDQEVEEDGRRLRCWQLSRDQDPAAVESSR
jgi:RimJ/RimL family protein N-acetyltransferase